MVATHTNLFPKPQMNVHKHTLMTVLGRLIFTVSSWLSQSSSNLSPKQANVFLALAESRGPKGTNLS